MSAASALPTFPPTTPVPRRGSPALTGIRVVDFSHFLAGPFCSLVLADLGAEVVKVEKIEGGDDFRRFPPAVGEHEGAPFLWGNRNKRSVAADLKQEAGLALARDLIARSDVLIENYSTGVMDRLGLGYASARTLKPDLIYCSISAFGREGAFKDRLGFDPIAQAESGFMALNGEADQPGVKTTSSIMDISTGAMAANAVLAALFARQRTGEGQLVECALYDQAVTMLGFHAVNYLVTGTVPERSGNASRETVPTAAFHACDGPFFLSCPNDRTFHKLVGTAMARPDLASDPRYATSRDRVACREELLDRLSAIFRTDRRETWLAKMRDAGVPAAPINTLAEAFGSPEMAARGLVNTVPHPSAGPVPALAMPFRLHGTPSAAPVAAPLLGADSEAVMRDILGYEEARIEQAFRSGAVSAPRGR